MEVTFMNWKIKVDYHNAVAKAYMPLLRDINKTKHPKIYAFADRRWRHHMKKSCQLIKDRRTQMKGL